MSAGLEQRRRRRGVDLGRVGNILLTIMALVGTFCIVATVAAVVLDVRPLVFRSGSMAPAIDTGALALARTTDVDDLAVGDVVSVLDADGVRITHRIDTVTVRDGTATLVLKGDANAAVDGEPYVVTTADRVLFDVPRAGYVVSWMSGPIGVFLGGLVVGGVLLSSVRTSRRGGSGGARRAAVVLVVLAIGGSASSRVGPQGTLAAFTDQPAMTSGTLRTFKIPPPVVTCTAVNGIQIRLSWAAIAGATSYTITSGAYVATVNAPATSYTWTPLVASGSATVVAHRPFGSPVTTTWVSTPSNSVTFAAVVVTTCT